MREPSKFENRTKRSLESVSLDHRERFEQAYGEDPQAVHSELVHQGYWWIASQLKVDYESGRLNP